MEVRSFQGLAGYYRKYVSGYTAIAAPLHRLTHQGEKFEWTPDVHSAFDDLKSRQCSAPILAYPDVDAGVGPLILDTDARNEGIGGVLYPMGEKSPSVTLATACAMLSEVTG